MKINLNNNEAEVLSTIFSNTEYEGRIELEKSSNSGSYKLTIGEDDATELRELCSDILSKEGFDQDYKVTSKGEVLESLIDKLYVP